jgi:redox-sensitive bicupin YhaK (pirin superfamily)
MLINNFMIINRKLKKIITGRPAVDGAGVKLVRVIGNKDTVDFDPFLMLDAFDSTNPDDYTRGFPWHPHRGIETITYLLEGDIKHGDSLGHQGSIVAGSCQWMTAGSGIIHQEMPQASPRLLGVQLWLNLPAKDKMTDPAYHNLSQALIPEISEPGVKLRIIGGTYQGQVGAMRGCFVDALYLDVALEPSQTWVYNCPSQHTVFVYILAGDGVFADGEGENKQALLFSEGEELEIVAGRQGLRFLLLAAQPLRQLIAWGGPIVMNTEEELDRAFEELDNGKFIKHQ